MLHCVYKIKTHTKHYMKHYHQYRAQDGKYARKGSLLRGILIVAVLTIVGHRILSTVMAPKAPEAPVAASTSTKAIIPQCTMINGVCDFTDAKTKAKAAQVTRWYSQGDKVATYHAPKPKTVKTTQSQQAVIKTVLNVAKSMNYTNTAYLLALADCESSLDPQNSNSRGNKPKGSVDRGLFMFNSYWRKDVSNACAYDVTCATKKTIEHLKKGRAREWMCDAIIRGENRVPNYVKLTMAK